MENVKNIIQETLLFKTIAINGGGLLPGFNWGFSQKAYDRDISKLSDEFVEISAYLKIGVDGTITVMSSNPEGGQNLKSQCQ